MYKMVCVAIYLRRNSDQVVWLQGVADSSEADGQSMWNGGLETLIVIQITFWPLVLAVRFFLELGLI